MTTYLKTIVKHLARPNGATGRRQSQGDSLAFEHRYLIDLRQIVKVYETPAGLFTALKNVDLQVDAGEFVAVIGKSGSGKSTLVNTITGIDRPTLGEVWVNGTALHSLSEGQIAAWRGRNLGVIFQFFQLLPTLTLIENIMLPMEFCRLYSFQERKERALYLLESVGMVDQAYKLPAAVSGGQQQRVAIARALANDPSVLVADEPTGSLDSKTADAIFQLFETFVNGGKTILMVTHDRDLASQATRVILIADGEIVDQHVSQAIPTLDKKQLVEISARLDPVTYPPGTLIFRQDDLADKFYIIIKGQVEVAIQHSSGQEIVSGTLGSGQYFGEIGLLQNGKRSATVRVTRDAEAVLMSLDRDTFGKLITGSDLTHGAIAKLMRQRLTANHLLSLLPVLSETQLDSIEANHEVIRYKPGAVIIQKGEPAHKFYLVTKGEVEIIHSSGEDKVIARLKSGQYFGEIGLLRAGKHPNTVRAAATADSEVEVVAIGRDIFRRLVSEHKMVEEEIALIMREHLAGKLQEFIPDLRRRSRGSLALLKSDDD